MVEILYAAITMLAGSLAWCFLGPFWAMLLVVGLMGGRIIHLLEQIKERLDEIKKDDPSEKEDS